MSKGEGIQLTEGWSASRILHGVLEAAVIQFPDQLEQAHLPESSSNFRKHYPELVPQFEASRLASDQRADIAKAAVVSLGKHLHLQGMSLDEAMQEPADPLPLKVQTGDCDAGWTPILLYQDRVWHGTELSAYAEALVSSRMITREARAALHWLADHHQMDDGRIHLSGRKVVVLGAGAEMASTENWLKSGADVLWLDVAPPPADWCEGELPGGRLHWPEQPVDLLTRPQEVLATIQFFAAGDPVDLCLYAYAPGQARELKLTSAMNAIVNALPAELIATVSMLVSPTTPGALSPADLEDMNERLRTRPGWETALVKLGVISGEGFARVKEAATTRTVVSIQGASYQAAQYVGKVLMADCWAEHGKPQEDSSKPLRVSANTAAITRTRSLDHPVFAAAFGGASALGVETLPPDQSRTINGLLAMADWFNPELPVPGAIRVHGGIHTLPYPLESALKVAAGIGFMKSPGLLPRLVTG